MAAEVKLPAIISDYMLIEQQMLVRIWGKAASGKKVSVEFKTATASATSDSAGSWEVFLPPMTRANPFRTDLK